MTAPYSRFKTPPLEQFNFVTAQAQVAAIRSTGYAIPTGHPRIFITPENREALRDQIARNHLGVMREAASLVDSYFGKTATNLGSEGVEPEAQKLVLACGMLYQLGPFDGLTTKYILDEYGREGVRHLMSLLDGKYDHAEYLGLPLGYDWLYHCMTPEQRDTVAARLLENAEPANRRIRRWNNPSGAGLLGALAVLGDGFDDARAQRLLDLFYNGAVFGEPADAPEYQVDSVGNSTCDLIFTPEGPGFEGIGYSRRYDAFVPLLDAWFDQTGEDYFTLPFFQKWILHYQHAMGNLGQHFDKYMVPKKSRQTLEIAAWYAMGLQRSNPAAAALAQHHYARGVKASLSVRLMYALRASEPIQPATPGQLRLPLTAHFKGTGNVFSRRAWEGDTTWFSFLSSNWQHVRDLGTANEILIYAHGGMLLGKKQQTHDYDGGPCRISSMQLTDDRQPGKLHIPANCMDRAVNRRLGMDLTKGGRLADLNSSLVGYSEGLRYFQDRPECVYVSGDGARAFPLGMLDGWNRQIVWAYGDPDADNESDREDVFVVVDRVAKSSNEVKEYILWQCVQEPEIRDRATNAHAGPGEKLFDGAWKYNNANRIVITNRTDAGWGKAHGRLIVDTLIPEAPEYHKMGGGTNRNIDIFGNLNKANMVNLASVPYAGEWRVEVSSQTRQVDQTYFHVLRVQDADTMETEVATVRLESDQIAVQVGNRIFMFSELDTEIQSGFFSAAESRLYNLWIGNLAPGVVYTLTAPYSGAVMLKLTASECGAISLQAVPLVANQRLTISRYIPPPPPPSTTANVRYTFKTPEVREAFLNFLRLEQASPGTMWEELPEGSAQ